jgi:hypothetical protein
MLVSEEWRSVNGGQRPERGSSTVGEGITGGAFTSLRSVCPPSVHTAVSPELTNCSSFHAHKQYIIYTAIYQQNLNGDTESLSLKMAIIITPLHSYSVILLLLSHMNHSFLL